MKICDSFYPFLPSEFFSNYFGKHLRDDKLKEIVEIELRCKSLDDIHQLEKLYGSLLDKKCDESLLVEIENARKTLDLAKENTLYAHTKADEIKEESTKYFSHLITILSLGLGSGIILSDTLNKDIKFAFICGSVFIIWLLYVLFTRSSENKKAMSDTDILYRKVNMCFNTFENEVKKRLKNK